MATFLKEALSIFWGNYIFSVMFYAALILITLLERDFKKRAAFLWYSVIVLVGLLNPLTCYLAIKIWGEDYAYYCRQFSLLPVMLVGGYASILCFGKLKKNVKFVAVIIVVSVIVLAGNNIYCEDWYTKAENKLKVPAEMVEISDWIVAQKEQPIVLASKDFESYISQYMPSIECANSRWFPEYESRKLVNGEIKDFDRLIQIANSKFADYIIINKDVYSIQELKEKGYQCEFSTENYSVYKVLGEPGFRCIKNDEGLVEVKYYVDETGEICENSRGYAIERYAYNDRYQIEEVTYFDVNNTNITTTNGYSHTKLTYNEKNEVESVMYYDLTGNNTLSDMGAYGVRYEYDDLGRIIKSTYIDDKGNPMSCIRGYFAVQVIYEAETSNSESIYLDADDNELQFDSRWQDKKTCGYSDDSWILSNYKDASGNQGLFYTLSNPISNKLIVIDSGWEENADQVRKVIKDLGGHVDAWFITHFDNDHVDAFNKIYEDLDGISIDKIYISNLDYEYYLETLREWDTPYSYEKFRELTGWDGSEQSIVTNGTTIEALSRGQELDVCGFNIKVFNCYDQTYLEASGGADLPNTSSLVFKISGMKDSILICGDCRSDDMSHLLIEEWGEELDSEYVQLGHHGNNSFNNEFYDAVAPDVALFDAPDWLMDGDQYTAKGLKEFFVDNNVECFDFTSSVKHIFWFE